MAGRSDDSDLDKLEAGRASEIRARRAATSGGRMVGWVRRVESITMSNPTSRICFSSDFPKKAWIILGKTDLDGLGKVWPHTSGLEASRCAGIIGPGFWQGAIILCKTNLDPIQFLLTVSCFDQTDPVRKQAGVQESSGPLLANASQPIRTGCELFDTGLIILCTLHSW